MKQLQFVVLGLSVMLAAALPVRSDDAPPAAPKAPAPVAVKVAEPVKAESAKPAEVPLFVKAAEPAGAHVGDEGEGQSHVGRRSDRQGDDAFGGSFLRGGDAVGRRIEGIRVHQG